MFWDFQSIRLRTIKKEEKTGIKDDGREIRRIEYPSSSTNLFLEYCMFQEILPDAEYSGKYNTIWVLQSVSRDRHAN